jgi:hypothetical protein
MHIQPATYFIMHTYVSVYMYTHTYISKRMHASAPKPPHHYLTICVLHAQHMQTSSESEISTTEQMTEIKMQRKTKAMIVFLGICQR